MTAPAGASARVNVADVLDRVAARAPSRTAVVFPAGRAAYGSLAFDALAAETARLAAGLDRLGIGRGTRVLLMVPPGVEMLALAFAALRLGAVLVLIDPGMGRRNLLHCIAEVQPEALVAVPIVHALSRLVPRAFPRLRRRVTVGRRWLPGGATLENLRTGGGSAPVADTRADDLAAIAYTSGSTGVPKGVPYRHGTLMAQLRALEDLLRPADDDVALSAFPPFGLLAIALGLTSVFPRMDVTRPARVDPQEILDVSARYGVTCAFGSPAVWTRVADHCGPRGLSLPVRAVLMAGAPVGPALLERLQPVLPAGAVVRTPYGATEAMPVTSITGAEILAETAALTRRGAGMCVGRPLPGVVVRIIRITDDPIPLWDAALEVPAGEVGEIVVRGDVVTTEYDRRPAETARAKIRDGADVWHRMGDVGSVDARGRLWFCGRKSHRVTTPAGTLYTVCCEAIFNAHPDVFRSALVGVGERGRQRPIIVIEPCAGRMPVSRAATARFVAELLALGAASEVTREIRDVLFHRAFPVDVRHNAKIGREKLAPWAARELARR